ncbi:MAG TPA: gamma-glutamylcyclotransferase [Candidatus Sulfotelmatobacter sp.]|nr:gamma-glutamylcyclotransferase [Candidatus Sulfotelmatobacter sp.]
MTKQSARPDFYARIPTLVWPPGDLWVFGYGSLMWQPGFRHAEAQSALLHGYHRALCMWSEHYRGTPDRPGLVFGLDAGGSCRGRAFRVVRRERDRAVDYLYRRELISYVYLPKLHPIHLADGRRVPALIFIADRSNPQYAGKLPLGRIARIIAASAGKSGSNRDYLANTAAHLDELGIRDGVAHRVLAMVERLRMACATDRASRPGRSSSPR